MTTVAIAAAQAALEEGNKANHRLSQTSNHSSASKRSKTHVGPWRLGRTLGRGSSGRVRLAKHSLTGQLAAVKIVPKGDDGSGGGGGAGGGGDHQPYGIEREVIIMKLIEHPNVMALYDVWENKGELYLVLEYVEGGELFDYLIKKGRLDEREAVNYFRQIIHGVDYCHKFNICHRDLKPENLLLDKNRNIKIADFGMAALEISDKMLETSCGSPHYASPEIVAGKNYHGAPSDIWSCGIILFALLTGHLPFDDDNIRKLLLKVQTGKYTMPTDISLEAQDLIARMLRVDPNKRVSMNEILRHPLLKKYPRKSMYNPRQHHVINPKFANADRPVRTVEEIDEEILKNLQILWHGASRERVIRRLLEPGPNSEKTFYCLLMKYRHDHLDDGDDTTNNHNHNNNRLNAVDMPEQRKYQPHHRKRSSQVSINGKKVVRTAPVAPPHSRNHSKNASISSVITASSSHRRNVAFVRKRASSSHMKHQSGNSTPRNESVAVISKPKQIFVPPQAQQPAPPPPITPDDFNFTDKRASIELASLCEHAFFSTDGPKAHVDRIVDRSDRTVSDPLSSIKPPKMATTEKRAFSLGEHEINSVEPGSRPYSAYSTVSETSTTSTTTATPYFLPMIFEEDRFADAIEEEVDLKIYRRPSEQEQEQVQEQFDLFTNFDMNKPTKKKRELVPAKPQPQPTKESSRLQISGLVKTESFKARGHSGFAAYRTPSALPPTTKPMTILTLSPPPSPTKETINYATPSNRQPTNKPSGRPPTNKPPNRPPPTATDSAPPARRPLAIKNNNIITSNDNKLKQNTNPPPPTSKNPATSLFRKLTLNPRRPPPPPPPPSTINVTPTAPTAPTLRKSSTKSNEVKQNWFMKMLNPQPSTSSTSSHSPTKTLFSTSSVTTMRHIIVEVLEDWQKYGISQINEDPINSTVTAVISSRNVLSMRSSKFRINVYPMQGGTRAVFTQEKGSSTSFLRFLGELERALGEMEVLAPPRTDPRIAIGLR